MHMFAATMHASRAFWVISPDGISAPWWSSSSTSAMASLGLGTDQVAGNSLAFQSRYFLGALLFLITLGLNLIGNAIVNRLRERC